MTIRTSAQAPSRSLSGAHLSVDEEAAAALGAGGNGSLISGRGLIDI